MRVLRAALPGFAPFATWNGTASSSPDGRCSLLGENGDVLVLQPLTEDSSPPRLRVERVLRAPETPKSFCQCWAPDGAVFAAARDRHVTLHDARRGFALLLRAQLRFSVTSMDLTRWPPSRACGQEDETAAPNTRGYLLAVGTAFGAYLHRIELPADSNNSSNQDDDGAAVTGDALPVLAAAYEDAPICFVRFAHDGATVALGTADGRLFVRQLHGPGGAQLTAFGAEAFAKVLASPRVTSICFAPCDSKLAAATRKGNVYVLSRSVRDATGLDKWGLHPACRDLASNPKPPPVAAGSSGASTAGAAVAMQTLVGWWGSVLVVASRAVNYRIELVDASSGKLVHAVQVAARRRGQLGGEEAAAAPPSAAVDDLLIGMCMAEDGASRKRLLCYDTSSSLSVITYEGLDVWGD